MISSSRLANRHDQTPDVSPRIERLLLVPLFALPVLWLAGYFFPPINHDVAAILDVSGRWVGGEPLYVEVIDENLPLTFIVHTLPVLTAKILPGECRSGSPPGWWPESSPRSSPAGGWCGWCRRPTMR